MVMHVLHAVAGLEVDRAVLVVGHAAQWVTDRVKAEIPRSLDVSFVEQRVQRGTGDAVMVGLTAFADDDLDDTSTVLIVPGDTPLLRSETLADLVAFHETNGHGATVLAAHMSEIGRAHV